MAEDRGSPTIGPAGPRLALRRRHVPGARGPPMSGYVTVRVWVSRVRKRSPGHASLALFPHSRTFQDGYVSFAPVVSGSVQGPGKFYPLDHDEAEYVAPDDDGPRVVWVGKIFGLDVPKMWQQFQKDAKL